MENHAIAIANNLYKLGPDGRTPAPDFRMASFNMFRFVSTFAPHVAADYSGDDNKISDIYRAVEIIDQPIQFLGRPSEDQPVKFLTPPARTPRQSDVYDSDEGGLDAKSKKYNAAWDYVVAVRAILDELASRTGGRRGGRRKRGAKTVRRRRSHRLRLRPTTHRRRRPF
jgi:hypothetical protein